MEIEHFGVETIVKFCPQKSSNQDYCNGVPRGLHIYNSKHLLKLLHLSQS